MSALPAHVMLEAYSVLTRLPGGLAVTGPTAAALLTRAFPEPPLRLSGIAQRMLPRRLAEAGVFGGSSYDGLVALEAATHSRTLLTLDHRAESAYRKLGVPFRSLDP